MVKNLGAYWGSRTACLLRQAMRDIPAELIDWRIADADAFFDNLSLWCKQPNTCNFIEQMFSLPQKGIKQYLANYQYANVGVAGECLKDDNILNKIKSEYLKRGYDVIILDGHQFQYEPTNKKQVNIQWE